MNTATLTTSFTHTPEYYLESVSLCALEANPDTAALEEEILI